MRKFIAVIFVFIWFSGLSIYAQDTKAIDSLKDLLKNTNTDTSEIRLLLKLGSEYLSIDIDESGKHIDKALRTAERIKDTTWILKSMRAKSDFFEEKKSYKESIELLEKGLEIGSKAGNINILPSFYKRLGWIYELNADYFEALSCFEKELKIEKQLKNKNEISTVLNYIGIIYEEMGQYDKAIEYFQQSLDIARDLKDKKGISNAINNLGLVYDYQGNNKKAIEYYTKSLEMEIEAKNKEGISNGTINIGTIHQKLGDYTKAIECFNKALNISKEIGDKVGIAICVNNIGEVHELQGNYELALRYFKESLQLDEERGDKDDIAISLMNVGDVNIHLKNYVKAYAYIDKALNMSEEIGDQSSVANAMSSMGFLYMKQGQYKEALKWYEDVLKLHRTLGEEDMVSNDLVKIGEIYYKMKNYSQAEAFSLEGLDVAQKYKVKEDIKIATEILSKIYANKKDYKKAYENHVLFKETYDSIFTMESKKRLNAIESRYELERKEQEIEKQKAKIEQQRIQQNILIIGIIAILFAVFVALGAYFRIRKAKNTIDYQRREILEANEELMQINEELRTTLETVSNQKEEISAQRDKIEIVNQEITASITYAKYIQSAILPHIDKRNKLLENHFVLYKPRNIVSGDFYWLTSINGKTIVVAGDCTGHGVPGAFMSILGISFLYDIVNKEGVTNPGKVLDRLREEVIHSLHQKGTPGEARDGMDVAVCAIDYSNMEIQFAGANNSLYIIRSKDKEAVENSVETSFEENVLYELKGNKTTIAYNRKMKPFGETTIRIHPGDTLYLFSDGYSDQFGGEKGKKFKINRFKNLLLNICDGDMENQREMLEKTLYSWKGDYEQIDDILILGFKV